MQDQKRSFLAVFSILSAIGILSAALFAGHVRELSALSAAMLLGTDPSYKPMASSPSQLPTASVGVTDDPLSSTPTISAPPSLPAAPSSGGSSDSPTPAGKVTEVNLSGSGNLVYEKIRMTSKSASNIDISQMLSTPLDLTLTNTLEPQVLIYHTHTTEGYMSEFTGTYPAGYASRTFDTSRNVVSVGDIITEKLNAAGIVTIHDTQVYDNPVYTGAYGRSLKTVEDYMKKYPSIKVVLDVHRDAIQQNDGTLLKPTTVINGRKAAQIMLVSGCDDKGKLNFPNWRKNLTFAVHLQQQLVSDTPSLVRPIYCWNVRYNAHMSTAALLVEFGSDANTVNEVHYSAELFANNLIALLKNHIK